VTFAEGDWCDALGDARFDAVVSNPPYIAEDDPHLDAGDLPREPRAALASGVDGLDAIRRIVACAPAHLESHGWLLLEHGWNQASRVRALLERAGFVDVESARDDAGHERVTLGRGRA
jgi:release factor glutamine methyltransferase